MADTVNKWIWMKVSTLIFLDAIYKICFKLLTNRQVNTVVVDYHSDVEYYESKKTIKIP